MYTLQAYISYVVLMGILVVWQLAEKLEKSETGRKKLRQAIAILKEKLDATSQVLEVNESLRQGKYLSLICVPFKFCFYLLEMILWTKVFFLSG